MKNLLLPLSISLLFFYSGLAQEMKRCSSAEYLQAMEAINPALKKQRLQKEAEAQQWIAAQESEAQRTTITIPVVFHLLYNDTSQYLDESIILSQLDVINEDYRRTNSDSGQTPLSFRALAADCEIEFCLAQRTPGGLPTDGIIHKYTTVTAFSDYDECKFNILGGDDSWDPSRYLNIWVAAFTNPNFLGLGTFPNSVSPEYDGVVINYKACGRIGSHLMAHYNKGRSLTHEIGHWLSLLHIWGDDGIQCTSDDFISDTPPQAGETFGCPSYPKTDNCSPAFPGIMFMNFMDYTDDECMNIFTQGQKMKMLATLNIDRSSILSSNGCMATGLEENDLKKYISVYPNPVSDKLFVDIKLSDPLTAEISITNLLSESVPFIQTSLATGEHNQLDLSNLANGFYFLKVTTSKGAAVFRIVKQ